MYIFGKCFNIFCISGKLRANTFTKKIRERSKMRGNPYEKSLGKQAPLLMRGMSGRIFLSPDSSLNDRIEFELSEVSSKRYDVSPSLSFDMIRSPLRGFYDKARFDDPPKIKGMGVAIKTGIRSSKKIEMCATECTQELFKFITGRNPSFFPGPQRPVERVSWFDALDFCNKLSLKLGLTPCYVLENVSTDKRHEVASAYPDALAGFVDGGITFAKVRVLRTGGFRLPQKTEWVFFASAGSVSDGLSGPLDTYFSGTKDESRLDEYAWFAENSFGSTKDVATLNPNTWGLYDMSGNVSEWCEDDTSKGDMIPRNLPQTEDEVPKFYTMGGCYDAGYLRCNLSDFGQERRNYPFTFDTEIGFRFCRDLD